MAPRAVQRRVIISNEDGNAAKLDLNYPALVTIDGHHTEFHAAESGVATHIFEVVTDDAAADIFIQVGSVDVEAHFETAAGADAFVYLYEAPTVSASGTALTFYNRCRGNADITDMTAFHTPTVTTTGTDTLAQVVLPGGEKNGSVGGNAGDGIGWVLEADTDYLFRTLNKGGEAKAISMEVDIVHTIA